MPDALGGLLLYDEDDAESKRPRSAHQGAMQGVNVMRILLADDQPRVRFALRVLLERQPGFEIIGEAIDADDLLGQAEKTCPDLVLLGWELPGLAMAGSLSNLRQLCPSVSVIALSGRPEARRPALIAGVDAFISKSDPPERLLAAIEEQRERQLACHPISSSSSAA
jgi:DNA-binding NarL/FixJ family response regulator